MGGDGKDFLAGGAHNDTLVGGAGLDVMRGDERRDVFKYNSIDDSGRSGGTDLIMDFEVGQDKIDLSAIDAIALSKGNEAFKYVEYDPSRELKAGEVTSHFDEMRNITVVEGNVYGDGGGDFSINLTGNVDLAAKDFVL